MRALHSRVKHKFGHGEGTITDISHTSVSYPLMSKPMYRVKFDSGYENVYGDGDLE